MLSESETPSAEPLTAEMQVLICCARRELTPANREELRRLLRGPINPDRLVELADRHKMLPLAWWHLRGEPDFVPPAAAVRLRSAFAVNATQMLALSAELLEIERLFASRGVLLVPYKGPALALRLYGSLALRQAGDLDLLVRRSDAPIARQLLLDRGYRPTHEFSSKVEKFVIESRYSEGFVRDAGPTLELHWAFTNGDIALPLDLDALAPRLQSMPVGGGSVRTFAPADLLLILCIHGSKHRWDRLEWLCGVGELLRTESQSLDWEAVVASASSLGVRRMLLLGVSLAHDLLDAPVPVDILAMARSDQAVVRLARLFPGIFVEEAVQAENADSLETDLFRFHLRERPRDRLRFIWYRLTTPSQPEKWSGVSVFGYWLPLHAFVRPFRLAAKLPPMLRRRLARH